MTIKPHFSFNVHKMYQSVRICIYTDRIKRICKNDIVFHSYGELRLSLLR